MTDQSWNLLVSTKAINFFCIVAFDIIFTTRRYASVVYAVVMCLFVCVCVSHAGIVSKWLNIGSCKQLYTIAQGL